MFSWISPATRRDFQNKSRFQDRSSSCWRKRALKSFWSQTEVICSWNTLKHDQQTTRWRRDDVAGSVQQKENWTETQWPFRIREVRVHEYDLFILKTSLELNLNHEEVIWANKPENMKIVDHDQIIILSHWMFRSELNHLSYSVTGGVLHAANTTCPQNLRTTSWELRNLQVSRERCSQVTPPPTWAWSAQIQSFILSVCSCYWLRTAAETMLSRAPRTHVHIECTCTNNIHAHRSHMHEVRGKSISMNVFTWMMRISCDGSAEAHRTLAGTRENVCSARCRQEKGFRI